MSDNYLTYFSHIPTAFRKGRNVSDGYARGWGLQFHDLRQKISNDPLYQEAYNLAVGRTIVSEDNRMNLYLIIRFYLERIPKGNIIEFGSYKGGNAIFMAYVASKINSNIEVFALDTYHGMPEVDSAIDAHGAGDFPDVDLEELKQYASAIRLNNLHFVQGLFEDTTSSVIKRSAPFSLVHIDCDIRSAVEYAYTTTKSHMVSGGYWVFDDATVASCLGATEAVEEVIIRQDGLCSEQIFPHFVFRAPL